MKHFVGVGLLIALAFVLRFRMQTGVELDLQVHDTYYLVPLRIVAFWGALGTAMGWLVVFAWALLRRRA
jgi:hypothetical protein